MEHTPGTVIPAKAGIYSVLVLRNLFRYRAIRFQACLTAKAGIRREMTTFGIVHGRKYPLLSSGQATLSLKLLLHSRYEAR